MNASWMLASIIISVLLAGAASVLSHVVGLYRNVPLRWIWIAATVASIAVSALWLRPQPVPVPTAAPASAATSVNASVTPPTMPTSAPPGDASAQRAPSSFDMPRDYVSLPYIPGVINRLLRQAWVVASLALAAMLAFATLRLVAERREWHWRDIANTRVLVSKRFGPAIVGVHRPNIVVPEWVLSLDESAQRAIITHEAEHRRAHDPLLVAVGLVAVVIMPWNIGLWMSWRGLRRAIEMDCDARVLTRGIDCAEYARVLLGAWKLARGSWLPSPAFAERASGLGARVEHLMRPEPQRRTMRTVLGAVVTAGLVLLACAAPSPRATQLSGTPYPLVIIDGVKRPELPPRFRFTGAVVAETLTTPTYHITYRGPMAMDSTAAKLYPSPDSLSEMQTIDAPASVQHFGEAAKYGAVLYYTKKYRDAGGAIMVPNEGNRSARRMDPATPASEVNDLVMGVLFRGITLDADVSAKAHVLMDADRVVHSRLKGPPLLMWPKKQSAWAARDASLRALLTNEVDRTRFDRNAMEQWPHVNTVTFDGIVEMDYGNLFGWEQENAQPNRAKSPKPMLPTAQKAKALEIIRSAINEDLAIYNRTPDNWDQSFDVRLANRVKRDEALGALLTDPAERAKFDAFAPRARASAMKPPQ